MIRRKERKKVKIGWTARMKRRKKQDTRKNIMTARRKEKEEIPK